MGVPTSPSHHDASGNPPREAPTDCLTIGNTTASTTTDTARRPPAFTRAEEDRTPAPRRETPPTRPKNRILGGVLRDDDDDDDDFAVRNGGAFRNKEEDPINDARRRHVVMIDDEDDCAAYASIGRFLFLPEVEGSHLGGLILAETSPAGRGPSPPPPPPPCRPPSSLTHPPRESSSRQSSTHDDSTATLSLDEDDVEDKHGSFGRLFLHPATVPRDPTDRSLRRVVPKKSILKRDDSSCCDSSGSSKTSVSFHSVEVREYDRTVGDHPSCRSGPPVSTYMSHSLSSDSFLLRNMGS